MVELSIPVAVSDSRRNGLADLMRHATTHLHREAEGRGFVAALIAGQVSLTGYALFLRNLVPAYAALEEGLETGRRRTAIREVWRPELARVLPLESDLQIIAGAEWRVRVPLLPQAEAYARRITAAAGGDGSLLIAHAYTRYLGDLAGGQLLKRCVSRALGLGPTGLCFYDFPAIADLRAFARTYRAGLDAAGDHLIDVAPVVAEARAAFELNIGLSDAVEAFVSAHPAAATTPFSAR